VLQHRKKLKKDSLGSVFYIEADAEKETLLRYIYTYIHIFTYIHALR